jgi:hypothetical protein
VPPLRLALPEVVARIGVHLEPVDVTNAVIGLELPITQPGRCVSGLRL